VGEQAQSLVWQGSVFSTWLLHCLQGVFYVARRFCALFQQHSTIERISHDNGVFGAPGCHMCTLACLSLLLTGCAASSHCR
jgi:hypothetical protein